MKALVALGLAAALVSTQTYAAEGRVAELSAPTLDAKRTSSYSGAPAGVASTETSLDQSKGELKQHAHASGKAATKTVRAAPMSATRSPYFYFREAASLLLSDRDRDSYHSEFRIRFDADSTVGDVEVYAKLYLRRLGESDWWLYHTTDDFWIDGQSGSDDYFVTTKLEDGFATSEYDVLIDLYESGYSGIVATFGPGDHPALELLPLEEAGLDVPIEISGYGIGDVSTLLITDADRDGYYSRFRITFDPDADFSGQYVYARIWVRAQGGEWIEEFVSEDFLVNSSGAADAYSLTADWISGYPTSLYDVQIDLFDSATDLLAASAGSERSALAQIPLEDQARDRSVSPPSTGTGGGSTSSREDGGGGALSLWWLLGLLPLSIARRGVRKIS
jgi:hypothetical protein